jgi:D-3-phosphoglycerate dehydrogenase
MVADLALQMGMQVLGYDPALSVDAAWRLSSQVQKVDNIQALFARADLVSLHIPALESTRGIINAETLGYFKAGAVLLNFAREELVNNVDLLAALESGQLRQYISDFPIPVLIGKPGVLSTPHLGASTAEAEENCAVMVADQLIDFLENGNIRHSVNFPNLVLERTQGYRIALANRNVPRILGSVLSILADRNINVIDMLNKSRDDVAYSLIDVEGEPTADLVRDIEKIEGVINVRVFSAGP